MKRIPTRGEITAFHIRAREVQNEADRMLANGEHYMEVCRFLLKEGDEVSAWDQSMYILTLLAAIAEIESKMQADRYLFEGRTTAQLIRLYRRTVLYLRRIEFDLPAELQREGVDYMLAEQISIPALYGMIRSTRVLQQKEIITERLLGLMQGENV